MRRQPELSDTKLSLYLQPGELARVQAVVRGALRVAFASSLAAASCTPAGPAAGGMLSGQTPAGGAGASAPSAGSGGSAPKPEVDAGSPPAADGGAGRPADDTDAGDPAADSGAPAATPTRPICANGVAEFMKGLKPAEPVDYAAWRTIVGVSANSVTDQQFDGMACATATDKTKCEQALAATQEGLEQTDNCGQIGACRHYIVTTQGDTVKRYATREQVLSFLGPLDSSQDVLLLLYYDDWQLNCERTLVREEPDGYQVSVVQMTSSCPVALDLVQVHVTADGTVTELSREGIPQTGNVCVGRRPEGLIAQPARGETPIGAHFAAMAELEAASVHAFERLAEELRALGAPTRLIAAACEAARDEVRHAQRVGAIAQRYGALPNTPRIAARPLRDLEALALDNAVEGCVRETFGAAVGCMQAVAARDPELRQAMHDIAADETRHAVLARELDTWLLPQLTEAARARVAAARSAAVRALENELQHEPDHTLRELAGLPDSQQAALLHAVLQRELWS
jgi:hypothetical protein